MLAHREPCHLHVQALRAEACISLFAGLISVLSGYPKPVRAGPAQGLMIGGDIKAGATVACARLVGRAAVGGRLTGATPPT